MTIISLNEIRIPSTRQISTGTDRTYEATFGAAFCETMVAIANVFRNLEAAVLANGYNHVERIHKGTELEDRFDETDIGVFKAFVLAGTLAPGINISMYVSEAYYKFGAPDSVPLYVRFRIGARGVIYSNSGRLNVEVSFALSASFDSYIASYNLATNTQATNPNDSGDFTGVLGFVLNERTVLLNLLCVHHGGMSNPQMCSYGYLADATTPNQILRPLLISDADAFVPGELGSKKTVAIYHGQMTSSNSNDSSGTGIDASTYCYADTSIVGQDLNELMSSFCPPVSYLPLTQSFPRKFVMPYFHMSYTGVVYEFPDLFITSVVYPNSARFSLGNLPYQSEYHEFLDIPFLVAHNLVSATASTHRFYAGNTFHLSLKV